MNLESSMDTVSFLDCKDICRTCEIQDLGSDSKHLLGSAREWEVWTEEECGTDTGSLLPLLCPWVCVKSSLTQSSECKDAVVSVYLFIFVLL